MKLKIILSSLIFALLALRLQAQVTNPERGLYVSNFFSFISGSVGIDASKSILGVSTKETALFEYCRENHITHIVLFGVADVIDAEAGIINPSASPTETVGQRYCQFLDDARSIGKITKIGIAGSTFDFFNNVQSRPPTPPILISDPAQRSAFNNLTQLLETPFQPGDADFGMSEYLKFFIRATNALNNNSSATVIACSDNKIDAFVTEYEFWNNDVKVDIADPLICDVDDKGTRWNNYKTLLGDMNTLRESYYHDLVNHTRPLSIEVYISDMDNVTNEYYYTLQSGDVVTCELTSGSSCASPTTATSNGIPITVLSSPAAPSITISASQTILCAGTSVTFTSTANNAGSSAVFTWKLNGAVVGTNAPSYSSSTLVDQDVITCELTSNSDCATTAPIVSNPISVTVTTGILPTVSITAPQTTICAGESVKFTAVVLNAGTNPTYQWKKNGANAGTNPTYTPSNLTNGTTISCEITSAGNACTPSVVSTSNQITITVSSSYTPSITITADKSTICKGNTVNFTSSVINGGGSTPNNPHYQWKLNGINVGEDQSTFSLHSDDCAEQRPDLINDNASTIANYLIEVDPLHPANPPFHTAALKRSDRTFAAYYNRDPSESYKIWRKPDYYTDRYLSFNSALSVNSYYPLFSAGSFALEPNGDGDFFGKWFTNGSSALNTPFEQRNIFTAEKEFYDAYLSDAIVKDKAQLIPGGFQWYSSKYMVGVLENPHIFRSNSPVCNNGTNTPVIFNYQGPLESGITWRFEIDNIICASGTTGTYTNSATIPLVDLATCGAGLSVGTHSAKLSLDYESTGTFVADYVYSEDVDIVSAPTIKLVSPNATVCEGNVVLLKALSLSGATYTWSRNGTVIPNETNQFLTVIASGSYYCTIGGTGGCTGQSNSISITVTPKFNATISVVTPPSVGSNCSVTLSASPSGASYFWFDESTSQTKTINSQGNFSVLVSQGGCTSKATYNYIPFTIGTISSNKKCYGSNTGTANLTGGITDGNFPGASYSYSWSTIPIQTGPSATGLVAGTTYTLQVTSSFGCVITKDKTINSFALPEVSLGNDLYFCSGSNTTSTLTANITSGQSPYTYTWQSPSSNNQSITVAPTNTGVYTYTVNVTDGNNCIGQASTHLNIIPIPNANISPSGPISICQGASVALAAAAGANLSYEWSNQGGILSGQIMNSLSASQSGIYSVTVTDNTGGLACASSTTNPVTVTLTPLVLPTISIISSDLSVCVGGTLNFNINSQTNQGLNPVYIWYINGQNVGSGTTLNYSFPNAGNYSVYAELISDANCTSQTTVNSNNITITVNPLPIVGINAIPFNAEVCSGQSITLSGTGATSYNWSNGITNATSFTPSSSGTYTVTGTDGNNCTNTAIQNVTVNPNPVITFSLGTVANPLCNLASAITLNGSTDIGIGSYSSSAPAALSGNSFNPNGLSGAQTITYTAVANGCTTSVTQNLNITQALTATVSINSPNPLEIICNSTYNQAINFSCSLCPVNTSFQVYAHPTSGGLDIPIATPCVGCSSINVGNTTCDPYDHFYVKASLPSTNDCFTSTTYESSHILFYNITGQTNVNTLVTSTNTTCNSSQNGAITIDANYHPASPWIYQLVIRNSANTVVYPPNYPSYISVNTPFTLPNLSAGIYSLTYYDNYNSRNESKTISINTSFSNPSPVITRTPDAQCNSNLNVNSYNSYQWRLVGSPTILSTSQSFTASVMGNYTVTVTNAHGCEGISVSKFYAAAMVPNISSSANLTCSQNRNYIVNIPNYTPNDYSVNWNVPVGVSKTVNGNSLTITDWGSYANTGTTISCTITNPCGQSVMANYVVKGCCTASSGDLNNATINSSQTFTSNFNINGNLTINGSGTVLTINGADVLLNKDAKIIVNPGCTLKVINAARLHSCSDNMWEGIVVYSTIAATGLVEVTSGSRIEDAKVAIETHSNSLVHIDNATFNVNHKHLVMYGNGLVNNSYIRNGSVFSCTGGSGNCICLKSPHPSEHTLTAIELHNTVINLGAASGSSISISNVSNGIDAENTNLTFQNGVISAAEKGMSIYGGWSQTIHNSSINSCQVGIESNGVGSFSVHECNLDNDYIGIKNLWGTESNYDIYRNNFTDNFGWAVFQLANNLCTHQIHENIITNGTQEFAHGIDIIGLTEGESEPLENREVLVYGNELYNTAYGIHLQNITDAHIFDNLHNEVMHTPAADFRSFGILIENCENTLIENNSVSSYGSSLQQVWWSNGIMADNSAETFIRCNSVGNIGRGLWVGGFSPNTTVAGNAMGNCYDQLYLNWNLWGLMDQGLDVSTNPPYGLALDNEWIGSVYSAGDGHQTTSYYSNSKDYGGYTLFHTRSGFPYEPTDHQVFDLSGTFDYCNVDVLSNFSAESYCQERPELPEDRGVEDRIAQGGDFGQYFETFKWMSKDYLLKQSKQDATLVANDLTIANEVAQIEQGNIGKIEAMKDSIISVDIDSTSLSYIQQLQQINNGLQPLIAAEANFKSAHSLSLNYLKNKSLTNGQKSAVRYLSELCPYSAGPGVYTARALRLLFETNIQPYTSCDSYNPVPANRKSLKQTNQDVNSIFQLYPSPGMGDAVYTFAIDAKSKAQLKVVDFTGRQILLQDVSGRNNYEFKNLGLSEGVYHIQLFVNDNLVDEQNMVVVK